MRSAQLILVLMVAGGPSNPASAKEPDEDRLRQGLALLRGQESVEQCRGAAILARLDGREAVLAVLARRERAGESVLACTSEALQKMDAVPVLMDWWRSADPERRRWAVLHALVLSQPALMPLYVEASKSADPLVRSRVVAGLRRQRWTPQVLSLLTALAADRDVEVRGDAMLALLASRRPEARRVLLQRLKAESNPALRERVTADLERETQGR